MLPSRTQKNFLALTGLQPDLLDTLVGCGDRDAGVKSTRRALPSGFLASAMTEDVEFPQLINSQDHWVNQMCHYLWIRSPALESTLKRAQSRYRQHFDLIGTLTNSNLEAAPDVNLVWLTHQITPSEYRDFATKVTGHAVDHNLELDEAARERGLQVTRQEYMLRHGSDYVRCHCWDCEFLHSLIEDGNMQLSGEKQLAENTWLDVGYYRAVERARRQKNMLPVKQLAWNQRLIFGFP